MAQAKKKTVPIIPLESWSEGEPWQPVPTPSRFRTPFEQVPGGA